LIGAEVAATDEAESYLGSLHSDVAEIVRAASIFGDEFDALTLAQLLEMDELDLEDRLAVAVRFGLLNVAGEWTLQGGEISTLYRFASTAVRASLHRSLTATQRQAFETRMSAL
jgi:predicted ATPase